MILSFIPHFPFKLWKKSSILHKPDISLDMAIISLSK